MNLNRSGLTTDDYFMTALRIFEFCGAESTGKLRVDALIDKFAPFVKNNKEEYSCLKSLLDPHEDNPEISVSMLAKTLQMNSDNHNYKVDFDESFNLKTEQMLGDSDSGISTDAGSQVEELQCELRSKCVEVSSLRARLEHCDKLHDDALLALAAERDTLRAHLNILREENMSLSHVRRDYEEACERVCVSERAMEHATKELDALRRRNKGLGDQLNALDTEKLTLQELLSQSKAECHRINEMYASRQSKLLDENEQLKTENADLSARLQDHADFVQQIIKEKVLLEMELKDVLNKSNQTQLRLDRSIDVSYTEEQMMTALDSLNSDTRFSQDIMSSVSTQADVPCVDCVHRNVAAQKRGIQRFFWEPIKCLFQVFAVLCFCTALCVLYGVTRSTGACPRPAVPWRWLKANELLDLFLRIEYVADVPM